MSFSIFTEYEAIIRLSTFASLFSLFLLWEFYRPSRVPSVNNNQRRLTNIGLMLLNSLLMRLFLPMVSIATALWAQTNSFGLTYAFQLSYPTAILFSLIALDLILYLQHMMLHLVPLFWRFHRVHHADTSLDVTTGVRFHPIEAIASTLLKVIAIITLGAPVFAVVLFEIILNALSLFNHSNINIHLKLEPYLRYLVVTPNMHRIHHSVIKSEYSKNFGFNITLWDRLFGTYLGNAKNGEEAIVYGQKDLQRSSDSHSLMKLLTQPFRH